MAKASKLAGLMGLDPVKKAEALIARGEALKASKLLIKGKEPLRAARVLMEAKKTREAIACYARVVFPNGFEEYSSATPAQMAGLLARAGHQEDAVALFELSKDFHKAAESALRLRDWFRAARNYERAQDWATAAIYYERVKRTADAARVLELQSAAIRRERETSTNPHLEQKHRELDLRRAELLRKSGDQKAAAMVVRAWPPLTLAEAQFVEEVGELREAVDAYLAIDRADHALRLLRATPLPDPQLMAKVLSMAGQHEEAARLQASQGRQEAAALSLELAGDHASAARRWELEGEFTKAAENFRRAERPRDAARCLAAAGDYEAAAEEYAQADDHREAANCYLQARRPYLAAKQLIEADQEGDAVDILKQIPVADPDYPSAVLLLAPRLIEGTSPEEALRRIHLVPQASREFGDLSAEWVYWEARALESAGRAAEALPRYQRLLATHSAHRDAHLRLQNLSAEIAPQGLPGASKTQAHPGQQPTDASAFDVPAASEAPAVQQPGPAVDVRWTKLTVEGELPADFVLAERYRIEQLLGRGGMGQVYRAIDLVLSEPVAIKTVVSGGAANREEERLLREVQICRKITHPNVVRVHDIGKVEGGLFVIMELIEGLALDRLLEVSGELPLARVRSILLQTTAGLDAAHRLGIVHRDLKPSNLIVDGEAVKILDFGIARMQGVGATITQTGMAVGSPSYMSPEQLMVAEVDGRSDLYALGVLAYRLLGGIEPFVADNVPALAYAQINTVPEPIDSLRSDLAPRWRQLVHQLLAKRPEDRPPSARQVYAALKQLPV